ncbi:peptidoglycan DD-metalloendopeptidase family protein [Rhodobacteraceae bacterium ASV31]|nr:peptidoglycan DD-metalloendopeptidase family protein [Anianabacter salinae]
MTLARTFGGLSIFALAACSGPLDFDLRDLADSGADTTAAVQSVSDRPDADNRGVISYPQFQVAVARRGDTVGTIATRVGLPAEELASYNALTTDTSLREGEVLALPRRVAEPSAATGASGNRIDVSALASNAIDRAEASGQAAPQAGAAPVIQTGPAPIRHQVVRGETAYSISRLYGVSVRSLADWNGLGPDLSVREGQFLLIPVASSGAAPSPTPAQVPETQIASAPGAGSVAPLPPSSAAPLPDETEEAAAAAPPASPNLGSQTTAASASGAKFRAPVSGPIISEYSEADKRSYVVFAADNGTPVRAAADGTVTLVSPDTTGNTYLVIRHSGNVSSAYAEISDIKVAKDQTVKAGDVIATVNNNSGSGLRFLSLRGAELVNPAQFLP